MKRACFVAASLAASASAQTIQWNNLSGGDWNNAANWNPQNIPNAGGEHASFVLPGEYTVSLGVSPTIGQLVIYEPDATLSILAGAALTAGYATMVNEGVILINGNYGTTNAQFRTASTTSLTGHGQIVLLLGSADLNDASLASVNSTLTQGKDHTLRGAGTLSASLVSSGTVRADSPGEVLLLATNPKVNSGGLMEAANGGILRIRQVTLTQKDGGTLHAAAGRIEVSDAEVTGGRFTTEGDSFIECTDGISILTSIVNEGSLRIGDGAYCRVKSSLENLGTISVNPEAGTANATLQFNEPMVLDGIGSILLRTGSNDPNDADLSTHNGPLTLGKDHAVRGAGRISAYLVSYGTVLADQPGGLLQLAGGTKHNRGLFGCTGGATLQISAGTVIQHDEAVIRADGGTVSFVSAYVAGGIFETPNGGQFESTAGNQLLEDVTNSGALNVLASTAIHIRGDGIVNDGVITINSDQKTGNATIRFDERSSLLGTGQVVLKLASADLGDAQFTSKNAIVTQGKDHTIRGAGLITTDLINNGAIIADAPGRVLQLSLTGKTNNGLLASSGGILRVNAITITQGEPGMIRADAGTVEFQSATITGGALGQSGDGIFRTVSGTTILNYVTVSDGRFSIGENTTAEAREALINNGEIVINPDQKPAPAVLKLRYETPLFGDGIVTLRARPGNLNDAKLVANWDNIPATIGPGQTIRGRGTVDGSLELPGRISPGEPGDPIGQINAYKLLLAPSSVVDVEIAGPDTCDSIVVSSLDAAGTLNVTLIGGFVPEQGHRFAIITGATSGRFDAVAGDAGPGLTWKAIYSDKLIEVVATCPADFQPDGLLDLFDFLAFVNLFNAEDSEADCTQNGVFDLFDFLCFTNAFNVGC